MPNIQQKAIAIIVVAIVLGNYLSVVQRVFFHLGYFEIYPFDQYNSNLYKKNVSLKHPGAVREGTVQISFMGTSSFLIEDSSSRVLVDGFFTRNAGERSGALGLAELFFNPLARISSNKTAVECGLEWLNVSKEMTLDAVIAVHSHHDHAMDIGSICSMRDCGSIIGSNSTANIARGEGVDEEKLSVATCSAGDIVKQDVGEGFEVTLIPSRHVALPIIGKFILNQTIDEPLGPPAHLRKYKEGCSYSVLINHTPSQVRILVQGSANFVPGALRSESADVVLLSIAGMSLGGRKYMEDYWENVIEAVKPKIIVPCHWDDFSVPYSKPQQPTNSFDFWVSWRLVQEKAAAAVPPIKVVWMPVQSSVNLDDILSDPSLADII